MNPAQQYIDDVVNENILCCEYVQLSIKKHLRLLEEADEKGYFFDESKALEAIDTFKLFRHSKGDAAGKRFQLLPWQEFVLWYIFGWTIKKTGKRLVKKAYIEIPKKNGKTEFAAGVGLLLTFFDEEFGAETYIAAKNKGQAKICYDAMKQMIIMAREESPGIRRSIPKPNQKRIFSIKTNSFITALSKDSEGAEGINTHCAVVDELHAHPDGSQLENLESSMVARSQPLTFIITTAGRSLGSVCFMLRKTCIEVLQQIKEDDKLFSMIYTLDEKDQEDDKWEDVRLWPKANPSLGIPGGISIEKLEGELKTAKNEGVSKVNYFKTRHLNIWVSSISSWITDDKWKKCQRKLNFEAYKNRLAFGGLDLSTKYDLSAWNILLPPESDGEPFKFRTKLYLPEDNIIKLEKEHRAPYRQWQKEGYITLTPGNLIDFDYIENDIIKDSEIFDLQVSAYDRKFSTRIISNLSSAGLELNPYSQTTTAMNAPISEIETFVGKQNIVYDNPVMRWMMSNVAIYTDTDGYKKVNRNKSGKVDGIVALLMSVGQYLIWLGKPENQGAYKDEGIFYV